MDLLCENCRWFVCDEDSGEKFCNALLDEDEYAQLTQSYAGESADISARTAVNTRS